VPKVCIHNFF